MGTVVGSFATLKKQAKNTIDKTPIITIVFFFFDRIIFHVNMFLKKL